jgi:hypothetical protein
MIAKDFAFRGILTANKLSEFHDHGPGAVLPGQSGRNGHTRAGASAESG